ncbi:UvrD-helicase domain-containing protein [Flagellimonas algicola]|uniref:DNA 3'-5' helicase n=1 Tax=Flagellimonas algicola TaxID=2583815 RepID=A0ABY2WK48_9FLAO|nr:UvrD-helicase domain-containing protein [Allomuricauda algicola]TMU55224.1 ATP-dependent helicase [Allomuricauda algicola]
MVLETPQFKIYSASAGSGKTYSLTKEYLLLLLKDGSPSKFRQLLAITFTNKAVGEMKSRILESLYSFGLDMPPEKRGSLFNEIREELSLSPQQLQQRSQTVLQRILHNYSFFEISTIDKFNHKIIKTFARDLQLSQNFEVELDTDLLLHEAIGRLLERAGSDEALTQTLIAFSLEKIDEDKSWDVSYDLMEIGKLLFQEDHADHIASLKSKTIEDFKDIQKKISTQILALETYVSKQATEVLGDIEKQGFAPEDFPRQTLPNHFKKISGKEFNIKVLYANKLEESLQAGRLLKASDKRDSSHLATFILDKYLSIKKELYQRNFLRNIYGNIVPLTLLNEIAKEIKNIELDREVIPISALNSILSKEVRNQPVPFIYERMGEKYRHYFLDEFQDTSKVQWENLVPLIGNALESVNEKNEQGTLFLVGDVKQAIYRWRGGKAEQFLNLISGKSRPFSIAPKTFALDTNWRSYSEIVQFNNQFFSTVAPILKNTEYRNLFFEGCNQKPNDKQGGYIELSFVDMEVDNKAEEHCHQVLKTIENLQTKDYVYSDICILVRKNDHGMLLANFLSENQIPVVSSESLLLKNNSTVGFLISLLKVMENPSDQESTYALLYYLSKSTVDPHLFISSHLEKVAELLLDAYGFSIPELQTQPVIIILEKAIRHFKPADQSQAYLVFLLDEVLVVEKREGPGVVAFLKYWEQKKDKLSIAAPEHIDAVKIMTIHKSKGLEFPMVIFPFANALIHDPRKQKKSWVGALPKEQELGLDEFLINSRKEMLQYNEITSKNYLEEMEKTELDALNVLYVALTRAEKGLFILSETDKAANNLEQCNSYSNLFQYFLNQKGLEENKEGKYTFGVLTHRAEEQEEPAMQSTNIPFAEKDEKDTGFAISTRSAHLWDDERREAIELGNLVHHALSKIKTMEDVPSVLDNLQESGQLTAVDSGYVKEKIMGVVEHPQLREYFSLAYQILNEQEILLSKGKTLRPDRIAIKDGKASIIDYKTGNPAPSHHEQIMEYADALKAMDFTLGHLIIVYIDHEIKPLFL